MYKFASYIQTAWSFQLKIWVYFFGVMILQMKQKTKFCKIGPCTFNSGGVWVRHELKSVGSFNLQSWKKMIGILSDLGEETPFPWCNVDPSHIVRSLARSLNIDLMGAGKGYGKKWELLCFLLNNVFCTAVVSMGIVVRNCIRCTTYFFSRIVCLKICIGTILIQNMNNN